MDKTQYPSPNILNPIPQQSYVQTDRRSTNVGCELGQNDKVFQRNQQLYIDGSVSQSQKEYRNLKSLPPGRLKELLMQEILDPKPLQHSPTSSWGNPPDFCNSSALICRVDCRKSASNEFLYSTPSCLGNSDFFDGSLTKVYNQEGIASSITACNRKLQGVPRVASEMSSSHGRFSSIPVSSNMNEFSKVGHFEARSSLQQISKPSPKNHIKLQSIHQGGHVSSPNPQLTVSQSAQSTCEACNNIPRVVYSVPISTYGGSNSQLQVPGTRQTDHLLQQPLLQVDANLHPQSHMFSFKQYENYNQIAEEDSFKLPLLHQQFNGFQNFHSETSVLDIGPVNAVKPMYSSSPDLQNILLSYVIYKSEFGNIIDNQVSFLNHIHMTKCNSYQCNCNQYSILVSHFDNCLYSDCTTCAPMRSACATGKVYTESGKRKTDFLGPFCNREANGTFSDTIIDYLPPLKLHKMDNPILDTVAPAVNQSCPPDRVLHVVQQYEAALYSENLMETDKKLPSPEEDLIVYSSNRFDAIDHTQRGDVSKMLQLEESRKQKTDLLGAFCNREANGTCSDTIADYLPPLKCHKKGNPIMDTVAHTVNHPCPTDKVLHVDQQCGSALYSENVRKTNKKLLIPGEDQIVYNLKRRGAIDHTRRRDVNKMLQLEEIRNPLPQLELLNEAILYSDNVTEVSKDHLNPAEDRTVDSSNRCDGIDSLLSGDLNSTLLFLEKLISRRENGDIDDSCGSEITNDTIVTYQGLMLYDGIADNTEISTQGHEEATEVKYLDLHELQENCNIPAFAADSEVEMKSKQLNIQRVSWADYFSVEEMKEHLNCFGQKIGQNLDHSDGENICQLCAKETLEFAPPQLYCSFCGVPIKRNLIYYRSSPETGVQHCFCTACYRSSCGGIISFQGGHIPKNKLQKKRNNEIFNEPWVQCNKCQWWQHQICALYNYKSDLGGKAEYICPKCWLKQVETGQREPLLKTAAFGAKDLPRTMLSDHIEKRLFKLLKEEKEEWPINSRKEHHEVAGEADLAVRVVLSVDKKLEVKPQFLNIIKGSDYPVQFSYRSKVILLFQRLEGVDVCLFAMYVQEYGSECGKPNQRCVYISYLDSVKYLRPERKTMTGEPLRTFVYHEILIGYLDYCKKRGFSTCYIWACPPLKGEDFILYCHPEYQRTPSADKLRNWYGSMLKKAAKDEVVVDHTKFYDCFFLPSEECNTKITLSRLPYFNGDYWSSTAGLIIRDFEQESSGGSQRKVKRQVTNRTLKAMGLGNLSSDATKDVLVMQKLGQTILPAKDDFLVIYLQFFCKCCHEPILSGVRYFCSKCPNFHICSRCLDTQQTLNEEKTHTSKNGEQHILCQVIMDNDTLPDTEDNDISLDNDLFNDRHDFLKFCQSDHHRFDTLRRAKHSSMMILYHLHKSLNHVVDLCTEM